MLTDAEAAAMEQYEVERNEKDRAPSAAERPAPPVGGDRTPTKSYLEGLFRAGGGTVGGYNLVWLNPAIACSPSTARNAPRSSSIRWTAGCRR